MWTRHIVNQGAKIQGQILFCSKIIVQRDGERDSHNGLKIANSRWRERCNPWAKNNINCETRRHFSILILLWMTWIGNFKVLFSQSTFCILYSLQSKAIRIGSVLEITTFSSQSATISVASLLLHVVFFDLNRFLVVCSSMFSWLPVFC